MPLIALLVLIMLHAFFAAAEVAVVSTHKARLHQLIEEGHRSARLVVGLAENATRLLATTQLAIKLAGFLAVALSVSVYGGTVATWLSSLNATWSPPLPGQGAAAGPMVALAVLLITLVMVVVMLVAGELIPKTLAARYPESILPLVAYPLTVVSAIASPLARLSAAISRFLIGGQAQGDGAGLSFVTEEQIKTLVDAGEEGGVIEQEEKEMIYSIFELGDTLAREVMVPRIDVTALDAKTSIADALAVIVRAGHSRVPVYEDTIDNIVGILYAKDVLRYLPNVEQLKLRDILRPAYFVPETKLVDDLLADLQRRKVHIAIVVDEYGGVAGLVTIEDILEEIVGEIQDEYDSEEASMEVIGPNEVIFDGTTDLDDVNQELEMDLPTDIADTLGGLIHSSLGRVAVAGDRVRLDQVELTVLSVARRRVKKVKVTRLAPEAPPAAPGSQSQPDAPAATTVLQQPSASDLPEADSRHLTADSGLLSPPEGTQTRDSRLPSNHEVIE
jgi:magnesium and cobalt exporter, CNNM family